MTCNFSFYIYTIEMPYKTRKVRGKNCYKVYKPKDGRVFSKCTTKENAKKQMRLLRAIQFNKKFVLRNTTRGGKHRKTKRLRRTMKK